MAVEIPGLLTMIPGEPFITSAEEEPGEPPESEVSFLIAALSGGRVSIDIQGGGSELTFTVTISLLFKIVRFINDVEEGKESHIFFAGMFLLQSLSAWTRGNGLVRFMATRASKRAGEPTVLGVDLIIPKDRLLEILRDFVRTLQGHAGFAHSFVCYELISFPEWDAAYDAWREYWDAGVASGKYRENDYDLKDQLNLEFYRDTMHLSEDAAAYLRQIEEMLATYSIPDEFKTQSL